MTKQDNEIPLYYDGSSHVEFADEIAEGLVGAATTNDEEWRRYIGANPFGMDGKNPLQR